jgi:hypothetical protein
MTTTIRPGRTTPHSRTTLRSIGAIAAGLVATALLAAIADQLLHWLGVFPPWGQVTYEPMPYVLAVSYRTIFGVIGGYLTARLAPRVPLRHAVILGIVGVVVSLGGAVAAITADLGPAWYPMLLVALALPTAWLGGALYERRAPRYARV